MPDIESAGEKLELKIVMPNMAFGVTILTASPYLRLSTNQAIFVRMNKRLLRSLFNMDQISANDSLLLG